MLATALFALALNHVPAGFQQDGLNGHVLGTGTEGTTYEFEGTFAALSIPFTMTLVQDATHVSENAVIATSGASLFVDVQCGIVDGQATCTENINEGSSTTVLTESGAVSLIGVPVATGTATAVPSQSITSSSASGSSSSLSLLPPVITPTQTATSPSQSSVTSQPQSSSTTASGAFRNTFVGFGIALPALAMFLISF
ncbi:hypothetical protein DFH11DRAFT_1671050 [Phellopilus nigrolimitatus]|nr:hypothetical protein DFH11DRAFT_1671050 [Phellopilus nigrolimitatus]